MKAARVLVVDDEPPNIEILSRALAAQGHAVSAAATAREAAAALSAGAYDLVLLDHVLPGTTGMQALSALRVLTPAPIHLMSGYGDDDIRRDAKLLGAAGFFPKPFDLRAILAALEALPERPA